MLPKPCGQLVRSKTSPDTCVRCEHPATAHGADVDVAKTKTVKIWGDTIRPELCKSPSCRKQIYFAQNVATLRWIPFDVRPVALSKQREIGTNREAWVVELTTSHFVTCVSSRDFRRRK